MTNRVLLTGVAFAVLTTSVWAADVPPSVKHGWYEDGLWSVAGFAFADGSNDCVLANAQPTPSGETAFVLTQFGGGDSTIMFHDTTITANASGGSITFQIDGAPSFTARPKTDTAHNLLVVPLANTPGLVMTAFLHELTSGQELSVVTAVGTRTFDLSGSSPAFAAFGRCIVAMSPDADQSE